MAEIEKLFGKEEKRGPRGAWGGGSGGPGATTARDGTTAPSKDRLYLIDGKRAQNVTIALSQFKSIAPYEDLIRAVCSLDSLGGKLSTDHLENLRSMIPVESEVKNKEVMKPSEHPAEVFLRTAVEYFPDLPMRLDCFITCSHFGANATEGLKSARKVIEACNEVISSDKLARVLQKMLAVGNIMNQGTFRGNATGFTVDSLLRMINMKGADKKTSVLDYVVKSLYDRGEERVLIVADDLAIVEECMRTSGKDIARTLTEILDTYAKLKEECERIRHKRMNGEANSPLPKRSGGPDDTDNSPKDEMTSTSALFVHRMDDQLKSFKDLADEVGRLRGIMTRKVTELAEYFGEDEADCDTTSIFTVLQQFRRALKDSKASIERKQKSAQRAEQFGKSRRSSMA